MIWWYTDHAWLSVFSSLHSRAEYVQAYMNYIFNCSVEKQFGAFAGGFFHVCRSHVMVGMINDSESWNGHTIISQSETLWITENQLAFILQIQKEYISSENPLTPLWISCGVIVLMRALNSKLVCIQMNPFTVLHFQSLLHPKELKSMLLGNAITDFHALEKVWCSTWLIVLFHDIPLLEAALSSRTAFLELFQGFFHASTMCYW